jgi:hypothetical protein
MHMNDHSIYLILFLSALESIIISIVLTPPEAGTGNLVHKWETWANNLTIKPDGSDYTLTVSRDADTDMTQITTSDSGLLLNPIGDIWIPYEKQLILGEYGGFTRLGFNTGNTQNSIMSSNKDLRITTHRNLEIKASNTIFPAVNSITYLLASNAARYNELRACYGTGTSTSRYVSLYNDGTDSYLKSNYGNVNIIPSGNNATIIQSNVTIGTTSKAGCIQIRDSDNGGWSKCTILAGALSCSAGVC